jgi:hypothetical protein
MADETAPGDELPAENPKYDQAFFLKLAAKGKDVWNAWRRDSANKDVEVTFAGIDFSKAPHDEINFSGFEFGNDTDFSGCNWCGIDWWEVKKDPKAFKIGRASFVGAVFGDGANFDNVIFGDSAIFDYATFGKDISFEGATFGWESSFADAKFKGDVEFKGKTEDQSRKDLEASVREAKEEDRAALKKHHEDSWTGSGSAPDRFLTISFANARFDTEAVFSVRSFEADADFTNARFYYPPDFDAVTNASRIDFTGAHIGFVPPGNRLHWTYDGLIPVRLRAFRKIAEETKNHDLERDLYIEEREAERGVYLHQLLGLDELKKNLENIDKQQKHVWLEWRLQRKARNAHWLRILAKPNKIARLFTHLFWIAVMAAYWALADYGRSFALPFAWLGLSVPFFYWRYTQVLAPLMHAAGPANAEKYDHAVWMLAFGNAIPFLGPLTIDAEIKKFLFCPGFGSCLPIPPEGFQCWVVFQNLISIILVFFIGLALRNYFRIK